MLQNLASYKNSDGIWDCNLNISKEEWLKVLNDERVAQKYHDALFLFLMSEGYGNSCTGASGYGKSDNHASIRNKITHFGMIAQDIINRVEIRNNDNSNQFWLFPMTGRNLPDGHFEWTLRKELVDALLQNMKDTQQSFLEDFPLEKLKDLPIESYTNIGDNSTFCYRLEFGSICLGDIRGNTSAKFGIYKIKRPPRTLQV